MDIATKILIRRTIADSITGVSEKKRQCGHKHMVAME